MIIRCEKNVPGPFYTTGECMSCGTPEIMAPELLAPLDDTNSETFFLKQPETPEEIEHACQAIEVCCADALRYGGKDPAIIERLGNNPNCCDHLLPKKHNWLLSLFTK